MLSSQKPIFWKKTLLSHVFEKFYYRSRNRRQICYSLVVTKCQNSDLSSGQFAETIVEYS